MKRLFFYLLLISILNISGSDKNLLPLFTLTPIHKCITQTFCNRTTIAKSFKLYQVESESSSILTMPSLNHNNVILIYDNQCIQEITKGNIHILSHIKQNTQNTIVFIYKTKALLFNKFEFHFLTLNNIESYKKEIDKLELQNRPKSRFKFNSLCCK